MKSRKSGGRAGEKAVQQVMDKEWDGGGSLVLTKGVDNGCEIWRAGKVSENKKEK